MSIMFSTIPWSRSRLSFKGGDVAVTLGGAVARVVVVRLNRPILLYGFSGD